MPSFLTQRGINTYESEVLLTEEIEGAGIHEENMLFHSRSLQLTRNTVFSSAIHRCARYRGETRDRTDGYYVAFISLDHVR